MGYRQMQVAAMAAMLCGYDDFAQEIRDANGF
jgi:hypothetical protein